jgi:hypothetical protein
VLGHALSYVLAMPDPHHRDLALRSTGHDSLPTAPEAVLMFLIAGVAALVVTAWSGAPGTSVLHLGPLARTLAIVQVVAFAGQEILERLVVGAPLGDLVHEHVLLIGTAVQVAVAVVGALTLRWLARQAERIASASFRTRAALPRHAATIPLPATSGRPSRRVTVSARSVRAPPSA